MFMLGITRRINPRQFAARAHAENTKFRRPCRPSGVLARVVEGVKTDTPPSDVARVGFARRRFDSEVAFASPGAKLDAAQMTSMSSRVCRRRCGGRRRQGDYIKTIPVSREISRVRRHALSLSIGAKSSRFLEPVVGAQGLTAWWRDRRLRQETCRGGWMMALAASRPAVFVSAPAPS